MAYIEGGFENDEKVKKKLIYKLKCKTFLLIVKIFNAETVIHLNCMTTYIRENLLKNKKCFLKFEDHDID